MKTGLAAALIFGSVITFSGRTAGALEPLDRKLQTVYLGMTPEAFLEAVPSVEMKEMYLSLLPQERFVKVKEEMLADGIAEFTGRFFQGRLFKIAVEYRQNWFSEEDWDSLITAKMERFGKTDLDEMAIPDGVFQSARWEDPETIYILRRQVKVRFRDKKMVRNSTVFVTVLDKADWERRSRIETRGLF